MHNIAFASTKPHLFWVERVLGSNSFFADGCRRNEGGRVNDGAFGNAAAITEMWVRSDNQLQSPATKTKKTARKRARAAVLCPEDSR